MKNHFSPRQAIPTTFCFTLSLHWWYSVPSLVWFGQLLDPLKKIFFFKFLKNSQFAKFAKFRMKTQLFPRHALPKIFLLYNLITLLIIHTAFGLIWTTPWPAEKKIKNLKNSQFAKFAKFRMKTQLFPRRAQPIFFCFTLSLHWWYSIPPLVWFGHLLNPTKKPIFKIPFSWKSQNSVRKPNFFPRPALPICLLYTLITRVILNTPFGLILTTPWTDAKGLFLKFSKFSNSRNSQNSVWKSNFFLGTLYQKLFCFTLSLHWWYSIPRLVWFGQLLDPLKKN